MVKKRLGLADGQLGRWAVDFWATSRLSRNICPFFKNEFCTSDSFRIIKNTQKIQVSIYPTAHLPNLKSFKCLHIYNLLIRKHSLWHLMADGTCLHSLWHGASGSGSFKALTAGGSCRSCRSCRSCFSL